MTSLMQPGERSNTLFLPEPYVPAPITTTPPSRAIMSPPSVFTATPAPLLLPSSGRIPARSEPTIRSPPFQPNPNQVSLSPIAIAALATQPLSVAELKNLPAAFQPYAHDNASQVEFFKRMLMTLIQDGATFFAHPLPLQHKVLHVGKQGKYWYFSRNGKKQHLSLGQTRTCADQGYLDGPNGSRIACPNAHLLRWDPIKNRYFMPLEGRPKRNQQQQQYHV